MEIRLYDDELDESLKLYFNKNMDMVLNELYSEIPEGKCSGCTNCCHESVNASYVEFLRIYEYFQDKEDLFDILIKKIFQYYFLEPVERKKCPFLNEEGRCYIYSVRPLTCRVFGSLTKEDYYKNLDLIKESNLNVYDYYKSTYNFEIPQDVLNFQIEFCEDYKSQKKFSRLERDKIIEELIKMDNEFFKNSLLDETLINKYITTWFMLLFYDLDSLGELRVTICKEFLNFGNSKTLNEILSYL